MQWMYLNWSSWTLRKIHRKIPPNSKKPYCNSRQRWTVNVRLSESPCHITALHSLIKRNGLVPSTAVNNSSTCAAQNFKIGQHQKSHQTSNTETSFWFKKKNKKLINTTKWLKSAGSRNEKLGDYITHEKRYLLKFDWSPIFPLFNCSYLQFHISDQMPLSHPHYSSVSYLFQILWRLTFSVKLVLHFLILPTTNLTLLFL